MSNQTNDRSENNGTIAQLVAMLEKRVSDNQKQLKVIDTLTAEIQLLREQITYLTNKLYG
ncbi:hypothetical protein [Enterococcus sp. DIV1420a]|uniref:hypothetical protein n=1 Tax=Enterococcus sp. DIV1420a TaxID=2774672 RepID=UPI003F683921